jgi:hypothetical protein
MCIAQVLHIAAGLALQGIVVHFPLPNFNPPLEFPPTCNCFREAKQRRISIIDRPRVSAGQELASDMERGEERVPRARSGRPNLDAMFAGDHLDASISSDRLAPLLLPVKRSPLPVPRVVHSPPLTTKSHLRMQTLFL